MKKLLLGLALLVAITGTAQTTFTGTVVKVKDGDTVVVLDSTKTMFTIRLAGVDAPEKKQDFGQNAKQFTSDEIFKKTVTVKIIKKDRYGRIVAWVIYDKKNLAAQQYLRSSATTNAGRILRFICGFLSTDTVIKIFAHKLG